MPEANRGGDPRYGAPPAGALRIVALGDLVAILHRRSGATHLVASPAPEILEALADGALTLAELSARLEAAYDMAADQAALAARVGELVEAGLVDVR